MTSEAPFGSAELTKYGEGEERHRPSAVNLTAERTPRPAVGQFSGSIRCRVHTFLICAVICHGEEGGGGTLPGIGFKKLSQPPSAGCQTSQVAVSFQNSDMGHVQCMWNAELGDDEEEVLEGKTRDRSSTAQKGFWPCADLPFSWPGDR